MGAEDESLERGIVPRLAGVPRSRDCITQMCDYKVSGERGREPRAWPSGGRAASLDSTGRGGAPSPLIRWTAQAHCGRT
jgi:hypothetical protein